MQERNPQPYFVPLLPLWEQEPRDAGNPAYFVGTLLQARPKGFILDSEIVGIAWEQPKYGPDGKGGHAIVRPGNQHLYRIRQLKNGISHILTEADIIQYFEYYKPAEPAG